MRKDTDYNLASQGNLFLKNH